MRFEDFLQQSGIQYRLPGQHKHCHQGWINVDCPKCSHGLGKFKLGYKVSGRYLSCWSCGAVSLQTFLRANGMHDTNKITEIIGSFEKEYTETDSVVARGTLKIPKGIVPLMKIHKDYIKKRNLDWRKIVKIWKVGGIGLAPKLSWRLFIPIIYRGELVSWTTRALDDSASLRYISARPDQEILPHKDLIYGIDMARNAGCVFEGPIDAWSFGPGGLCTFGTVVSPKQVNLLAELPIRGVCFDNQKAAQVVATKLVSSLAILPGETINIQLMESKDLNSSTKQDIKKVRHIILS